MKSTSTRQSEAITIRDAVIDDALAIGRVQVIGWQTTYRGIVPDSYLDLLTAEGRADLWRRGMLQGKPDQHWLVAESPTAGVIGFIASGPQRDDIGGFAGEYYALYILPEYQGCGLGTRLLHASSRKLRQHGLTSALAWVLAANPRRRFYEARGGRRIAEKTVEIAGRLLPEVAYGFHLASQPFPQG